MKTETNVIVGAWLAIFHAEFRAHQAVLEEILQHIGLQEIEGLPVKPWIAIRRSKELEKFMLEIGDVDPAGHDAVRACLSEAVKELRRM